jgi:hypothetical protein
VICVSGAGAEVSGRLSELLQSMRDWERRPLVKVGRVVVELVKLPRRESRRGVVPERLALHIRLEDSFKGVFVEESSELEDLLAALQARVVREVARSLDDVNRRRVIEYGI